MRNFTRSEKLAMSRLYDKISFENRTIDVGNSYDILRLQNEECFNYTPEERIEKLDEAMQMREYLTVCYYIFGAVKKEGNYQDFINDLVGCMKYFHDNCSEEVQKLAYLDNNIIVERYMLSPYQHSLFVMLRAAKHDPVFATVLLGLYKKWFPEEWKIFKRYKKLSEPDIQNIIDKPDVFYRFVTFAYVSNMEMDYNFENFLMIRQKELGSLMRNAVDVCVVDSEDMNDFDEIDEHKDKESDVYDIISEKIKNKEGYRETKKQVKIIDKVYSSNPVPLCHVLNRKGSLLDDEEVLIKLYMMAYYAQSKEEVDIEELSKYLPCVYGSYLASCLSSEEYGILNCRYTDEYPSWVNSQDIVKNKKTESENTAITKGQAEPDQNQSEKDALEEKIKQLEEELSAQKLKFSNIKGLYDELKSENDSLKKLLEDIEETEDEEPVEDISDENVPVEEDEYSAISFEEKVKYLNSVRCCFVGGQHRRLNRLREFLSEWVIIPAHSENIDNSYLKSIDNVFVYPKYLDHPTYYHVVNRAKEMGKRIDFVYGVNLENTINKLYKSLKNAG